MDDGKFQWDDRKAASNVVDHGVTFDTARDVFKDPFAVEQLDDRENYGEDRFTIIGMARGRLVRRLYDERRKHSHHIGA
jgi:uncharacterized DUF497 family protein